MQRLAGRIVDLHQRRIFPGVVEWSGGRIRRIVEDSSVGEKWFIAPGFVDAHIHIESSMLLPAEFARWAVVHGTVATVSDPHEIANVLGAAGVNFMVRDARRTPFNFNFGVPSCVPATAFETSGASLDAPAVGRLLARREFKYLSEVMNFPGVLAGDRSLMAMIAAAHANGKPADGHAPGLRGKDASAYAAAGITTDHECFTLPEAHDKLAAGMKILIREGSAARNFDALAPLLKSHPDRCMFCCDDLHPDLLMIRHIDDLVRRALRTGADQFDVLRCASVNPVEHYQLDAGLLRPGDFADFIVFDNFKNLRVRRTYVRGELVARDGRTLIPRRPSQSPNNFKARPRLPADFRISPPDGADELNVIEARNGQLITGWKRVPIHAVNGAVASDPERDLLKIAVINRYRASARPAVAFVSGFGLKSGAIASSVAHDSHNIVAIGADDRSLCAAVNLVVKNSGGISAVGNGKRAVLPLPVAGLMSTADGRHVARRYTALDRLAKQLGSRLDAPFMTMAFMALLVIPDLKLSDRGLFSGSQWTFVPPVARRS
jgi:adenine deaminase